MVSIDIDVNMRPKGDKKPTDIKMDSEDQKIIWTNDTGDVNANLPSQANIGYPSRFKIGDEIQDYEHHLKDLKERGRNLRTDGNQPSLSTKPDWFDQDKFQDGKQVFRNHMMAINFAHLSGLLLLVRVDSIYNTLSSTGKSDSVAKLFRRYYNTMRHVKQWYEGDIFEANSQAQQSLQIVRGMHNKVSEKFNCDHPCRGNFHISQYDIMLTQFAFLGFIVVHPKKFGMMEKFSRSDLVGLLHFWRIIGYYLGAHEEFNLCSYEIEQVHDLCKVLINLEYRNSLIKNAINDPQGIMSLNIARSLKFIPMLTFYGMMRHVYEIIGHDTREIENKKTWYSNLSYTLIRLVMCRLLAYRAFRVFNNGLIRLSIFCVGFVEDWFANLLQSSYGDKLRASQISSR